MATKVTRISPTLGALTKHISGFVPSRISSTQISLTSGVCRNIADDGDYRIAEVSQKTLTSPSNNTTYHVLLTFNSVSKVVDWYYDTSISGANKPVNTVIIRRLFSFITDGSANIPNFLAYEMGGGGLEITYSTTIKDWDNAVPGGTTAILIALSVPSDIKVQCHISASMNNSSASSVAYRFSSLDQDDLVPTSNEYTQLQGLRDTSNGSRAAGQLRIFTNTSRQIRARASVNLAFSVGTEGWIDLRK